MSIREVLVRVKGLSPYTQSRFHDTPKLNKELPKDYENRTWKNRLHTDSAGMVYIPSLAFKNCLAEIAKFLSVQIPGKARQTYTKHFESGIIVSENCPLGIHESDVEGQWFFVPSDGKRGGGKRVNKCYPTIKPGWETTIKFSVLDDAITEEVFLQHMIQAGQLIGVGAFRVRNNGVHGRFQVLNVEWNNIGEQMELLMA